MDEGFGNREGQFGSTDLSGKEASTVTNDDWPGQREGQFGSTNPLTPKTVTDDDWSGNREQQR